MTLSLLFSFLQENWLALIGATISIIWVYLEYKASIWLWPVGIILPIFYILLSWESKLYGNIAVNIYYLITSIIGWVAWLRKPKGEGNSEAPIQDLPAKQGLWYLVGLLLFCFPIYWGLVNYTDSRLPWLDTLSTAISFLGMIWLSLKYRQVWFCWLASNLGYAILFYIAEDYISAGVFLFNLFMSVMGYINWSRLKRIQDGALS